MRIRINARCAWGCLSLRGPDEATKSAPQHLSCGAPWRKIVCATRACAYRVKAWRKSAPHLYFYRRTVAQPAQKKSGQIAASQHGVGSCERKGCVKFECDRSIMDREAVATTRQQPLSRWTAALGGRAGSLRLGTSNEYAAGELREPSRDRDAPIRQGLSQRRKTMLLFSPGGRQIINAAVDQLGDPHQREVWQSWAAANPRVRRAGNPWDDGGPPLPREVVEIVLLTLSEMARAKRTAREHASSEDEAATFDNDLSRIKSVLRLLTEGPPARPPMVAA